VHLKVGRNELCPCGSGRKYKRCCLRNQPPPEPLAFDEQVRSRAWDAVFAFANRDEFVLLRGAAKMLYFGEDFDQLSPSEQQVAFNNEAWVANFMYWLVFEATFEGSSRTIVNRFLARKGSTLRLNERRYLEAMAKSNLRLYEVESVALDVGVRLRDCWNDERFDVRERLFTHDAVPKMVIALRLRLDPDGSHVIDGPGFAGFTHQLKEDILEDLRDEYELVMKADQNADGRFSFYFAPVIAQHYLHDLLLRPLPRLTTTSGDPMMFCRVVYDVLDETALRSGLESVKQIGRNGDGSYTWVRGKGKIIHAIFRLDGTELVIEATSERRAGAARALVERQAGKAVRYRTTETEDPQRMLAELRNTPESERDAEVDRTSKLPPEVEAKLVNDAQEKYYRKWLDMPLPVLGNFTPRQAAAMPRLRPTIVGVLKDFAVMAARERGRGKVAYDISWLWSELGLDPAE